MNLQITSSISILESLKNMTLVLRVDRHLDNPLELEILLKNERLQRPNKSNQQLKETLNQGKVKENLAPTHKLFLLS